MGDAERLCGNKVSDTTARERRDEWIAAGVFETIANEAICGYDRLSASTFPTWLWTQSLTKSLVAAGETGKNPTDRASSDGSGRSSPTSRDPFGWTADSANRNDSVLLAPTLENAERRGLTERPRPSGSTVATTPARRESASHRVRIDDAVIAKKRKRGNPAKETKKLPMGLRWPVERTNSWL